MRRELHTIIALVENKPGVLNRVASLFRRRGFNIEEITVGDSENPNLARITLVVGGGPQELEQVRKQLEKLVEVVKVSDVTSDKIVAQELALIKVKAPSGARSEIVHLAQIFGAEILHVGSETMILKLAGEEEKLDTFIKLLRSFGIKELARTGKIAMVCEGE